MTPESEDQCSIRVNPVCYQRGNIALQILWTDNGGVGRAV